MNNIKNDMDDIILTAMCLWEAFLETPERFPNLNKLREDDGTPFCRLVISNMAKWCWRDWNNAPEETRTGCNTFDWDFCPDWLREQDKKQV